jgi:glycosyltransferase involved in cell wall biosynthesis
MRPAMAPMDRRARRNASLKLVLPEQNAAMVTSMDASRPVRRLRLLAPPLEGPPTGGTLYNRALLAALREAGVDARAAERWERGELGLVDSLYLERLPALKAAAQHSPTWLLLHYLPAQVRYGRAVAMHELSASERAALAAADGVIVTSRFMAQQLAALGVAQERVLCVEPGVTQVARAAPSAAPALRALVLGSVVEAKGQLALLRALASELRAQDALQLDVVGSLDAEPAHAAACQGLIASQPALRARVIVHGALAHERALELLAQAGVLVSASRMEAYGMALSEARAAGVPIIARVGGNAAEHAVPEAGGVLCADEQTVARELLAVARNPALLAERDALARAGVRARSWSQAAAELASFFSQREI